MTPNLEHVDLRHLRALRAVARAGSFHGAATDLGYTQSAVSQQIKALERTVGHQLLERTGARSPALPTQAGWVLLRHCEVIFARLGEASHDLGQLDEGVAGAVRIGYFESIGRTYLPAVVRQVGQQMPNVELRMTETDCDITLQGKVAVGELDMTFAIPPFTEPAMASITLFDDPAVVVVTPGDPFAHELEVDVAALRGRRIASFGLCAHQRAVDRRLALAQCPPIAIRADENATLAGLVASETAVAVMTRLSALEAEKDGLVAIPVRGLPARNISLAYHADRPLNPAATVLRDIITAECAGREVGSFSKVPQRPLRRAS